MKKTNEHFKRYRLVKSGNTANDVAQALEILINME